MLFVNGYNSPVKVNDVICALTRFVSPEYY